MWTKSSYSGEGAQSNCVEAVSWVKSSYSIDAVCVEVTLYRR
jgi:hypothetical protein